MDKSTLDITQLQRRDPAAWTTLVQQALDSDSVTVTDATAVPMRTYPGNGTRHHVFRYLLTLAGHSDPVTFVGKRASPRETIFYHSVAPLMPFLAPRCFFASMDGEAGWIVIEDVPNHFPPHSWKPAHVDEVMLGLADLHAAFWNREASLFQEGLPALLDQKRYTMEELRASHDVYFEEGPGATISEHAINHAGGLAPKLLEAANGLSVIRDLGGWPGILGESQLRAAADLLDDPVPMLEPLRGQPLTLLHGDPSSYHWRLTLFDELRLFNWSNVAVGPAVYDLVSFLEQFDLLYVDDPMGMRMRQTIPDSEETMTDTYVLAMSGRLRSGFDARSFRQAIPAARCLFILTSWFPRFAKWFSEMPNKYAWQKVNRMSDANLAKSMFRPMITLRPYLAGVFERFLHAYRTL